MQDYIVQLEKDPVPIEFVYKGKKYEGEGIPTPQICNEYHCFELGISLNEENIGIIHCTDKGWKMKNVRDQKFVNALGAQISKWYKENP